MLQRLVQTDLPMKKGPKMLIKFSHLTPRMQHVWSMKLSRKQDILAEFAALTILVKEELVKYLHCIFSLFICL